MKRISRIKRCACGFIILLTVICIGNLVQPSVSPPAIPAPSAVSEQIEVHIILWKIYYRQDKDAFSRGDMYVKWTITTSDGIHNEAGRIPTTGTAQVHRRTTKVWDTRCVKWKQPRNVQINYNFRAWDKDPVNDDAFPRAKDRIQPWIFAPNVYITFKHDVGDCVYRIVFLFVILPN